MGEALEQGVLCRLPGSRGPGACAKERMEARYLTTLGVQAQTGTGTQEANRTLRTGS